MCASPAESSPWPGACSRYRSYDYVVRVGLVGCVKTKGSRPSQARDLYDSTLFRGRRRFVEATCERWFVLSAKHGLVAPDEVIAPYDETLNEKPASAKRQWATAVLVRLAQLVDLPGTVFEVHAGAEYRNFGLVDELRRRGATVEIPAADLSQGEQLAFYARSHAGAGGSPPSPASRSSASRGSYGPLAEHLAELSGLSTQLSFAQIERILARPLPASARRHRAWWSNDTKGSHSHASAWMGTGWLVDAVDLNAATVRFRRGRR